MAALAFFLLLAPGTGVAQSGGGSHEPPRFPEAEVVLDGRPDEPVWERAWTVRLSHQLAPNEGDPPSRPTEVRLFYDDEAIYLTARMEEDGPAGIVDRDFERNAFHRSDQDGIAIVLDTNRDGRTAYGFIVTPSGARSDVAIADDARVTWNTDWNAFWDAASVRDEGGWTVEMRIPFSSLRFEPDENGDVTMGVILWRYLARYDEFSVFPEFPNDWGNSAYKPGVATPVVFRGVQAENPLYVKPYVLGGVERRSRLAAGGDRYVGESSPAYELGVDLKYNVTNNLVLDLTANTDFAQVEADDERFNLERFSLFFPEKRDFFQERSDLFVYRLPGGSDRLFHSRQIGIADGQPIPIHGGARLTGRHGGWDVGVLNMQTASAVVNGREISSENFGVARVQRPVLDRGSYVGGLFTSRTDLSAAHNLVYALDADLHLGNDNYLGLQAARSAESGAGGVSGTMGTVILQRRINRGISFGSSFSHISPGFRPAVGFVRRTGLNRWGHRTQYTWFPGSGSRVQNHSLAHRVEFLWDDRFDVLETNTTTLSWTFGFRSGASARSEVQYAREFLERAFTVGGLEVPPGRYRFVDGSARYSTSSGSDLQASVGLDGGGYFGGHRIGGSVDVAWKPGPFLSLGVENSVNRIQLPAGRQEVLISRLRLGTALNRQITTSAYIQYNSSGRILTPNVRIRYNPREGSDLFLVYNEGFNTSLAPDDPELPRLPRSQTRSVQLKYTYTFVR